MNKLLLFILIFIFLFTIGAIIAIEEDNSLMEKRTNEIVIETTDR